MVTIVHVAYFPLSRKGGFQHSASLKLTNGMIRAGHFVLNFSDRDVARAGSFLGHRTFGRAYARRTLREFCRTHRPDVLVLGHADTILAETVAAIRADLPTLRVLQWNLDPMFEPDNVRRLQSKLAVVDATLVSTAGAALAPLRRPGMRLGFLPNPVDFSIERGTSHLKPALPYDLFYGCGHPARPKRVVCGTEWNMDDFMRALLARLPRIKPFFAGLMGQPHITGAPFQQALESAALGLNISRRADHFLYSSDRLPQLMGNGMVALIERATGYDTLFSDAEMAFFSSFDELVDLIERFTADPAHRMAVAAAGRARYHALFNETRVGAYLVDVALDRCNPATIEWPTLVA
jgi:Glycosyl transferases group 1